uniref:Nucleotidyltransferase domain-containing protein n=1 Tax=Candidatus Kentrum sp. LPFa TaxID=2126335 RepID=A0A450XWM3_9GAMM|nr:MAG: Nucleotidyltransferase domain-containing protein [Candidatus Kentron sp. LPFa]VFK33637.1 MAG: Nucleotidyltransferase domain-containing protein [Candidatus Kentron sp. LPFa]
MEQMRLTERQRTIVYDCGLRTFGSEAKVRLFGSRLDEHKKGGDIDLLVECPTPVENAGFVTAHMSAKIQMQLGERKIDILYTWSGRLQSPVHEAARREGIVP